ncbi:MAG TPA: ABC transporter ATP-binding protein [Phycisphaerales bacterium]|nr:ABC transporter ATP-binding protein [Phycisphaerales bacterium]
MPEVRLSNIEKVYPGGGAVGPCSLDLPDRACTVIVGPSGCGKTTLLRLITGLETPTRGSITIGGLPVDHLPPSKRGVALMTQDFTLYPHMTVAANMGFPLRMQGVAKGEIANRVAAAAEKLGIAGLLDRKPGSLSGGERQRAALGKMLVQSPACALFDEPLSNLDAPLRASLRLELRALMPMMSAMSVYVTHDREEAMSLADMLVVMAAGKVQQIGTPEEIYASPCNRFVASFIGAPCISFVQGCVEQLGDARVRFTDRRGFHVDLNRAVFQQHIGCEIVLGIRGVDIALVTRLDESREGAMNASVSHVEPLGDRTLVHLEVHSGVGLVAQHGGSAAHRPGDAVAFRINHGGVRCFLPGEFGDAIGFPTHKDAR